MKKQERIAIIGLAGFLITYFCYQIAYGVAEPANGIPPENTTTLGPFLNLSNTTWNMYNESSGSTSTIHFGNDNTYTRCSMITISQEYGLLMLLQRNYSSSALPKKSGRHHVY